MSDNDDTSHQDTDNQDTGNFETGEPIIIQTGSGGQADAAVIWLHGLGADGGDFVPVVEQLQLPQELSIRFIFPHAPVMPVSINQGYPMRAWYDIRSLSIVDGEDEAGITASSRWLATQCDRLIEQGIEADRIILAGFSQGGAIALHCACRYPRPLGGIMALSTYLPLPDSLDGEISAAAKQMTVFMAHGTQDDVVAIEHGRRSRDLLLAHDIELDWHEYGMQHSVCMEELSHIRQWLIKQLG